jgi:predicted O-methyltransferase YrrM
MKNGEDQFISTIAKSSLSLPFQCRFLYRLIKLIHPELVLEFGTSLGIATGYIALGNPSCQVLTVEGDPHLVSRGEQVFHHLDIRNVSVFNATFEDFIRMKLAEFGTIDFIFLDGNHHAAALLDYYNALKKHISQKTIIMIDDIYWSKDMQEGWTELISLPEVTQSVDCFRFGLLFFNPDFIAKENHLIRLPFKSFMAK